MTKVYDGHTNKEFNKNYEKFQEAAIFFWNGNIKTIISQAADTSLRKYKEFTQKKILTTWDDETKLIAQ